MNTGAKIATAVAAGYLLGRTKKLKLAIVVGGLLAGRKLPTDPRELVQQGMQYLQSSPELARLTEQVRGTLLNAVRSAAVSTASSRLDSLSESLHQRSERLRGTPATEQAEQEAEEPEAEEPEAEEEEAEEPEAEEEEAEEPEAEEEEPEEEPAEERPRKRAASKGTKKAPAKKSASTGKKAAKKSGGEGAAKKASSGRGRSARQQG